MSIRIWNKSELPFFVGDVKCRRIADRSMKEALSMVYPLFLRPRCIEEGIPENEEVEASLEGGILGKLLVKKVIELVPDGYVLSPDKSRLIKKLRKGMTQVEELPAGVSGDTDKKIDDLGNKISQLTDAVASLANMQAQSMAKPKRKSKSAYKKRKQAIKRRGK